MIRYNMTPLTYEPERVIRHSSKVIYQIVTNSVTSQNAFKSAIIKTDLSYHFPIVSALTTNEKTQKLVIKSAYKRSYCEKNTERFKITRHNRNWDSIKKIKTPTKHINILSIVLLTFMTSRSQKQKIKLNSRMIRALGLLKVLQNYQKKKIKRHIKLIKTYLKPLKRNQRKSFT